MPDDDLDPMAGATPGQKLFFVVLSFAATAVLVVLAIWLVALIFG